MFFVFKLFCQYLILDARVFTPIVSVGPIITYRPWLDHIWSGWLLQFPQFNLLSCLVEQEVLDNPFVSCWMHGSPPHGLRGLSPTDSASTFRRKNMTSSIWSTKWWCLPLWDHEGGEERDCQLKTHAGVKAPHCVALYWQLLDAKHHSRGLEALSFFRHACAHAE